MVELSTFDVSIVSKPTFSDETGNKRNTRNIFCKELSGGMIGDSEAQMIAAHPANPGSAAYVAIEHFTGSVDGSMSSMFLQHQGLMETGEAALTSMIIPVSGIGELVRISGGFEIGEDVGKHSCVQEYER